MKVFDLGHHMNFNGLVAEAKKCKRRKFLYVVVSSGEGRRIAEVGDIEQVGTYLAEETGKGRRSGVLSPKNQVN
jgi:hypothetical protein